MTDGITGGLALYLYSQASIEFRKISFAVMLYFVATDLIFHHFIQEFRDLNRWAIFLVYMLINATILIRLDYLKSHMAIKTVISLHILWNIAVAIYLVSTTDNHIVYNMNYSIALSFAVLSLIYMLVITDGLRNYIKSRNINYHHRNNFMRMLCHRSSIFQSWYKV